MGKKNFPSEQLPLYYEISPKINPHFLTLRELECVFFILRSMSAKETSERIQLSKRTVEFYRENIKNKFNCHKKSELIASAIRYGYMNFNPRIFNLI